MEGITKARIDKNKGILEIECAESITAFQIAEKFVHQLNNPIDGSTKASEYIAGWEGTGFVQVKYAGRKQALVIKDKNFIKISDNHFGVGIKDISSQYERLCKDLGAPFIID